MKSCFNTRPCRGPQSSGDSATIGLEYNDGYSGLMIGYNRQGAAAEKQAIRFFPRPSGAPRMTPGCLLSDVIPVEGGEVTLDPFCLLVPPGTLKQETRLHFTLAANFSPLPPDLNNLGRFADIILEPLPPHRSTQCQPFAITTARLTW
jgi:hypothetical protein